MLNKVNVTPAQVHHTVRTERTPHSVTLRCSCGWWSRQTRHQNARGRAARERGSRGARAPDRTRMRHGVDVMTDLNWTDNNASSLALTPTHEVSVVKWAHTWHWTIDRLGVDDGPFVADGFARNRTAAKVLAAAEYDRICNRLD